MIRIAILCTLFIASTAFADRSPLGPYGGVITSISVGKEGIYIGTEGSGVFHSTDGGRSWKGRGKGLENLFVESLGIAEDGTMYSGTRDGVFKSRDGKSWEPLVSIPRGSSVKSIAFDKEGNLIASVWGKGVFICKKDTDCINSQKELSSPFVNSILPMENGDVVVSTEGGVFLKPKDEEKWRLHGLAEYMIVPAITLDGKGILYAGTWGGGIHYFEKDDWRFRSMGVASSMVATLAKGPDNNLYAGTEAGVSVLKQGSDNWSTVGLENSYVKALGFGSNGEIYAGGYGKGFFAKEKGREWEGRNRGIYNSNILSMAFSDKGEIFAGTKQGLYISAKGDDNWIEVPDLYGMKVNSLLVDGNHVYAGTSNGLFAGMVSEKGWKRVEGEIGFLPVTALTKAGIHIYAGTDGDGIYRSPASKGEWSQVNEGLENPRIRSLVTIDDANVYAGTYDGVYTLQKGMTKWMRSGLQNNVVVSLSANGGAAFAAVENMGAFSLKDGRWVPLDGALPNNRILSVLFAGKGLYASGYGWLLYREGDGPWKDITGHLSNTVLQTIATDKAGKVYVGTWGSGIWRMD
jgi:ligand-binding sensor domain-containing protein